MSECFQIGDVVQLKRPPGGELASIDEELFAKVVEYFDFIHDTSYKADPPVCIDRLLLVIEIFSGTSGYSLRGYPLSVKSKNTKAGFLENVISIEPGKNSISVEYIAIPISVNAKKGWIERKITQIPVELASEIGGKKYQFVIGRDPGDD